VFVRLREEHRILATLLDRLQELVSADRTDSKVVLAEVDGLITPIEAYLDHGEASGPCGLLEDLFRTAASSRS
jgi:hypothetical protein